MTTQTEETMSVDEIGAAGDRWRELRVQIEQLSDEAEQLAWPLERAARKIASAEHKLSRTTSHCHFRGIDKDGRAHFDIIDGYDDEYQGSTSYALEQLADPDTAIATIKADQQAAARKRAEEDLARAQARLAQLETEQKEGC